jgi:hypothetical protein
LIAVVQNVVSSLLNSHLFDFHEGWIYVLTVGVAGGMVARAKTIYAARADARSAEFTADRASATSSPFEDPVVGSTAPGS